MSTALWHNVVMQTKDTSGLTLERIAELEGLCRNKDIGLWSSQVERKRELLAELQALLALARRALEQPSGVVTREHREIALRSCIACTGGGPLVWETRWAQTGELETAYRVPQTRLADVAQAIADTEAAAHERGKRDGA